MSATVISDPTAETRPWAFRMRPALVVEPPFDDEPQADPALPSGYRPGPPSTVVDSAHHSVPVTGGPPGPAAARYVQVCLEVLNGFRPSSHLRTLTGPVEFGEILRQLRVRRNAAQTRRSQGVEPARRADLAARTGAHPGSSGGNLGRPGAGVHDAISAAPNMGRFNAAASPTNARTASAYRLQRLRIAEPLAGIAEVVAVLSHADRSLALAMRLEARGAAWVCTVVQVI